MQIDSTLNNLATVLYLLVLYILASVLSLMYEKQELSKIRENPKANVFCLGFIY